MSRKSDGDAVNLGNSNEVVTIRELARTIVDISDKELSLEYDRSKPTGTDRYACDMSKMREELAWEPEVPLEVGLRTVYRWAQRELERAEQEEEPTVSAEVGWP
jgi:nucleoside-diphosphate-sugar epimerase